VRRTPIMLTYEEVHDPNHKVHAEKSWFWGAVEGFARAIASRERGGFPCTFGPLGAPKASMNRSS
jgi:hypothetical protein